MITTMTMMSRDLSAQATVRVEFHGNRYYEAQDVLKDGAFVTNSEPRRHPYGFNDSDRGSR